jgi:hypothetical protein
MTEIWKAIPRFDNLIEASNLGRIRTVDRVVQSRGGTRTVKGRLLKFRRHPWGYFWCEFMVGGKRYWQFVHRLVAEAFYGPCPVGYYVLHGDNNPANSKVENLRYGTPTENSADKLLHGTQPFGEEIAWSKLKSEDILAIRNRRSLGEKLTSIAKDYGVSEVYIHHICIGVKWANEGGPITSGGRKVNILDEEKRIEVLRLRGEGMAIWKLAKHFGVSNTQIHNLVKKHENKERNST